MIRTLFGDNDNDSVDPNEFWRGLDIHKLPKTKKDAEKAGVRFFFTEEECIHGHLAPRYAKGGRCVTCARMHSARQQDLEYKGNAAAARASITRAIAATSMRRTYEPSRPCKHGHRLRYVGTNNCVECQIASQEKHKRTVSERRLIKEYGLNFAARDALAESQGWCCCICRKPFGNDRAMHVDHCHATGKVRGMLCALCNQAIGLLKEDPTIIRSAARYVEDAAA